MNREKNFHQFVDNLIITKPVLNKKNLNLDIKKILIRSDYVELCNDKELYEFFKKEKYNLKFSSPITLEYLSKYKNLRQKYFSFQLLKNFLKENEFFVYLYFKKLKSLIPESNVNNEIVIYIAEFKHFLFFEKLFKKQKLKYSYFCLTKNLLEKINKYNVNICNFSLDNLRKRIKKNKYNYYKYHYQIFNNYLKINKTSVIIGLEGDDAKFEIFSQAAKNNKVKSVCLQWGCYPFYKPRIALHNMSCDYFLSWGKYFSRQLASFNKNVKFINVGKVGTNIKIRKQNIFTIITSTPNHDVGINKWLEIFKLIEKLAKNFKKWRFVIRDHANYTFEEQIKNQGINQKNIIFQKYSDQGIEKTLGESKFVFGVHSSALIEGLAFNTIPIVFQANKNLEFKPDFNRSNIGIISNDLNILTSKIKESFKNKKIKFYSDNIKKIKKNFFQNINKDNIQTIHSEINKIKLTL